MFVLNPSGVGGPGSGGGEWSQLMNNLYFFGRVGLYFCAIRGAYVVLARREASTTLKN
jgi:hypothetical protein